MVGKKTRRTLAGLTTFSLVVASAGCAPRANAEDPPLPDIAKCNAFPVDSDALMRGREEALPLPADWAGFAVSSPDWIAIATGFGSTHCVDISWYHEANDHEIFNERFAGFEWKGFEAFGYVLIDRIGQGHSFDTGAKPVFSPSGSRFAAMQVSDAGWGGFEGFGVWNTYGNGVQPIEVNTRIETYPMVDWRIERWEGEDCLHISAVHFDRLDGDWKKLSRAERTAYVAGEMNDWQIVLGDTCPVYDGS